MSLSMGLTAIESLQLVYFGGIGQKWNSFTHQLSDIRYEDSDPSIFDSMKKFYWISLWSHRYKWCQNVCVGSFDIEIVRYRVNNTYILS